MAEIVGGTRVGGVAFQGLDQEFPVEHVDAHGSHGRLGIPRRGRGIDRFLVEFGDAVVVVDGHHAEAGGFVQRHLDDTHRDVSGVFLVESDHRAVVHFVNVIAGQYEHLVGRVLADQVEVLVNAVCRAEVPVLPHLLLRRDDLDELAELAAQVAPAAMDVLDQRLRLVLRHDEDLPDSGIDAVGQGEIDDTELARERGRGFGADLGQVLQSGAAAASHDHRHRAAGQLADETSGFSRFHEILLQTNEAAAGGDLFYHAAARWVQPGVLHS